MPTGLFDSFDNLDAIDIDSLSSWLKNPPSSVQLENYLANKILYPTTLPVTDADMQIDLAILREALRMNSPQNKQNSLLGDNPFLNITLRKMIIPQRFLSQVPDMVSLTWAFVDGLLLNRSKKDWFEDLWTVVLADDADEVIGSLLLPQFKGHSDSLKLSLLGKDFKIKPGSLTRLSCPKQRCEIAYEFAGGKILGKRVSAVEVYGGRLGLMIDGRVK